MSPVRPRSRAHRAVVATLTGVAIAASTPVPTFATAGAQAGAQTGSQAGAAGRPAASRDPEVLAADGRDERGRIVTTSPALDGTPISSEEYDGAAIRRDRDARDLADANHRIAVNEGALARLEVDREALADLIARTEVRRTKLDATAASLARSLRSIAIGRFVRGSDRDRFLDPTLTLTEQMEQSHVDTLTEQATSTVETHARTVATTLEGTVARLDDLRARRRANEDETATATRELTRARSDAEIATASLIGAEEELRAARPMTVVTGSDLPFVALDAYWRAARDLATTRPACGLSWWGLAGVGRAESNHGRATGGQAGADGTVSVPVYGIPLDGTNGTRLIPDTDDGRLDLDPDLDRAVGVMQFIPGTWKRWAEDQSGDGTADPQNLYDAALAAGKLLCSASSGLDTDAGLRRAYFAYNRSEAYVSKVLGYARAYGELPVPPPA